MDFSKCMVKSCKSKGNINGITYHRIPKKYEKEWLEVLRPTSKQIKYTAHLAVCSLHFKAQDFTSNVHYLKPGSIPSLNLDPDVSPKVILNLGAKSLIENALLLLNNKKSAEENSLNESNSEKIIEPVPEFVQVKQECEDETTECNTNVTDPLAVDYSVEKEFKKERIADENLLQDKFDSNKVDFDVFKNQEEYDLSEEILKQIIECRNEMKEKFEGVSVHDYSFKTARRELKIVCHYKESLNKKIKTTQQRNRRLEKRIKKMKNEINILRKMRLR